MKYGLFDTETTDLIRVRSRPLSAQPHVTEFFGLRLEEGMPTSAVGDEKPTRSFAETSTAWGLFNPQVMLSAEVQKITGLTDADLADKPIFDSPEGRAILAWIEENDAVVAHNLGFDMSIMDFEAQRCGYKINWPKIKICTVESTEHLFHRRLKLTELHEHLFGEGFPNAHRAENDVRPMARCFIELMNRGVL